MWVKPRAELRPFTPPLHHSRKASTLRFQAAGFRPLVASVPLVAIGPHRKTATKRTRSTKRFTERQLASLCFLPFFSFSVFPCFSFPLSPHAAALGRFGGERPKTCGRGIALGYPADTEGRKRWQEIQSVQEKMNKRCGVAKLPRRFEGGRRFGGAQRSARNPPNPEPGTPQLRTR